VSRIDVQFQELERSPFAGRINAVKNDLEFAVRYGDQESEKSPGTRRAFMTIPSFKKADAN